MAYIRQAVKNGKISGDGPFTSRCQKLMERRFRAGKVLLTTSCTSALEMAAILADIKPKDEVLLPSFTFVSTANAFVLRGGHPKFVDIRADTLNLDERKLEERITRKTKAICAVHYGGIACELDAIMSLAQRKRLVVIEDAAQGVDAKYKGRYLGTIGDLGAYSFHETKNCISGEGGAIVVNRSKYEKRAEIIWEKGTNRCQFFRGEVDKYTWQDIGSSFLPSELVSAFLLAQLEHLNEIRKKRARIFAYYHARLKKLEERGDIRLPVVPPYCKTNYHMFYLLTPSLKWRDRLIEKLRKSGILAIFHYVPLHLSPMGRRFGYRKGDFPVSESASDRLLRLPFYNDLAKKDQALILKTLLSNF